MNQKERIKEIQSALEKDGIDGWLFYSFRGSDPFASRVLLYDDKGFATRRWFYYLPKSGEPKKLVHIIEKNKLDNLPGEKFTYLSWKELHSKLNNILSGNRKIAMQYSPLNAIPYISMVDGGTIELVRSFGAEVVSSANLIQQFESLLSEDQLKSHKFASECLREIIDISFREISRRINENITTTEYDILQFITGLFRKKSLLTCHSPVVAVRQNTADPHYEPTAENTEIIRKDDLVLLDIWAKSNEPKSVYADITWIGFIGNEIPEKYSRIFEVLRNARDESIGFIRKHLKERKEIHGWEVDDVSRGVIDKAGFGKYFIHRTGHSIGEEVHAQGVNIDNLETKDNRLLMPGSCFSIEPGIYFENDFGMRSEINVFIDSKEAHVFGLPVQTSIIPIQK